MNPFDPLSFGCQTDTLCVYPKQSPKPRVSIEDPSSKPPDPISKGVLYCVMSLYFVLVVLLCALVTKVVFRRA